MLALASSMNGFSVSGKPISVRNARATTSKLASTWLDGGLKM